MKRMMGYALTLLTLAGCDRLVTEPSGTDPNPGLTQSAPQALRAWRTTDEEFGELERDFPGFAGMYMENGHLIVMATDPEQGNLSRAGVRASLGRLGRPSLVAEDLASRMEVRPAKYAFSELAGWKNAIARQLHLPGLMEVDADEARNVVHVTVSTEVELSAVEARLSQLGIPEDGREITVRPPPNGSSILELSLSGRRRPVEAGFKITLSLGGTACSIGSVMARKLSNGTLSTERYFTTASHCTGESHL